MAFFFFLQIAGLAGNGAGELNLQWLKLSPPLRSRSYFSLISKKEILISCF
jgi:hypothetical protein